MKADAQIRNYQSTVAGDAVKMSIDDSATAHIMDVLTKLYADPELAIIREYSTNALDSHVEAGVKRPIEVTLPTALSPFLTIRDYGIGLDAEGIRDIYSRYGTSTKRGSNEAVGMLGLGCKSALSYTDQFTLTGFKDGYRTEVLISRDEDGAGSMTIVDEGLDENYLGNGVKVTIPVKRENDVADKAWRFFSFWERGTVLVNGKQPRRIGDATIHDEGGYKEHKQIWLDDRTLLTDEVDESLVVMGNVPYPLTDGEEALFTVNRGQPKPRYGYDRNTWHAVCFVDIGEVNFAPSRESLMTTKRTKAKLAELRTKIDRLRDESVRQQIANAPDAKTAQELLRTGIALGFNKQDAMWRGRQVVLKLTREQPPGTAQFSNWSDWDVETCLKHTYLFANLNYARKNGERGQSIDLEAQRGAHIFTGFDGKALTNVKRAKLELWAAQKGLRTTPAMPKMIFVNELTPDEKFWLDGWEQHDWADVDSLDLPTTGTVGGVKVRLKGSYDCQVKGAWTSEVPAAKIAELQTAGTPIYWLHGNRWNVSGSRELNDGVIDRAKCVVVPLGANRVDKFVRDFPDAKLLAEAAREAAAAWLKKQKAEIIAADQLQNALRYTVINKLDPAQVNDPELKEAARLYSVDTSTYKQERRGHSRWLPASATTQPAVDKATRVLKQYPLLASLSASGGPDFSKHIHLYVNAVYAAQPKGV